MSTAIGFYLALLSLVGLVCIALTRDTPTDPLSPEIAERREVAVPG
jgi:hypothetical protein